MPSVTHESALRLALPIVLPQASITRDGSFKRTAGSAATLMGCGTATQGAVVVSQCRVLDLAARAGKKLETLSDDLLDDCEAKLEAVTAR